ncbi:MAG: bifunctional molybdenum cofactor biosynthesis protein MoaC/MoaB [Candidatus Marinimicrobia bacterium]|nr:bifunctional molybdenum cofactor biosynthesis protein MoaC/MoaB [Candidatus Neomarinimicrobiota bacterium]
MAVAADGGKASRLSHLDDSGRVRMVDISGKRGTLRTARARGEIHLSAQALEAVTAGQAPKGNVLTTAQLAGIQAAKNTSGLIPLCHPLKLAWVDVTFEIAEDRINIESVIKAVDSTGLEMEALTAVSIAALTIYDMCKSIDPAMTISSIALVEKLGGKSTAASGYRPRCGVIVASDSVAAGKVEDTSGEILRRGLESAGCAIVSAITVPDEQERIVGAVRAALSAGAELILTTGGTGLGPRDVTIQAVESLISMRLPGVEQALHAYGNSRLPTAMLSRLLAGIIDGQVIVCLPGSNSAVTDGLAVLVPALFHLFEVQHGAGHGR